MPILNSLTCTVAAVLHSCTRSSPNWDSRRLPISGMDSLHALTIIESLLFSSSPSVGDNYRNGHRALDFWLAVFRQNDIRDSVEREYQQCPVLTRLLAYYHTWALFH